MVVGWSVVSTMDPMWQFVTIKNNVRNIPLMYLLYSSSRDGRLGQWECMISMNPGVYDW